MRTSGLRPVSRQPRRRKADPQRATRRRQRPKAERAGPEAERAGPGDVGIRQCFSGKPELVLCLKHSKTFHALSLSILHKRPPA